MKYCMKCEAKLPDEANKKGISLWKRNPLGCAPAAKKTRESFALSAGSRALLPLGILLLPLVTSFRLKHTTALPGR